MAQFVGYGDSRDGAVSTANGTINSYAAMSGTAGSATVTTALSVSAGDYVVLMTMRGANVGQWEMVKVQSTGSGEFTADRNLVNTYAELSQAIKAPQYSAGTCSNNLTGTAWNGTIGGGIVMIVNGKAILTGTTTLTNLGFLQTNSVASGANTVQYTGEGTAGAIAQQQAKNGNGGGGGLNESGESQSNYAGGGGGGNGTAGANGVNQVGRVGIGGDAVGVAGLTTIFMGGAGGAGGGSWSGGDYGGKGARGSGFLIIIAKEIDVSGATINGTSANGGNNALGAGGGGGGGAGASILIKCIKATLGTNKIVALGGSGGASYNNVSPGGAGGVGRIHIDYGSSYTGTTNPTIDATKDTSLSPSSNFFLFF